MTNLESPDLNTITRHLTQLFESPHLKGTAQIICALICELNGISTEFRQLTEEKDLYKEKLSELSVIMKTFVENEPLYELDENVISIENDIFNFRNVPVHTHAENQPISPKTDGKNNLNQLENSMDNVSEIQETISNTPDSPILRKSKNKTISNSSNTILESPNKSKLVDKENSDVNINNKLHVGSKDDVLLIDELKEKFSKEYVSSSPKLKKHINKSTNFPTNKKSLVNMKQSRIKFKNSKPKNILDISKSNSFLGGNRNLTGECSKKDPENNLDLPKQFEDSDENNIDSIEESPSCISHKPTKIRKHKLPKLLICKPEEQSFDDDETVLIIPPKIIKKNPENSTTLSTIEKSSDQKLKSNNRESSFPNDNTSEEILSNRKKSDKNKLPGWSCKKCSDFYSVAFKGNEEMIRKKMNECSKHRGKINPERQNTPPGFWDVNMPQTPDDSAYD